MQATREVIRFVDRALPHGSKARELAKSAKIVVDRNRHALADVMPGIIRPRPKQITVAITAHCNLRCQGCNYPKGFMKGASLSLPVMQGVIDDAAAAGIDTLRVYGGEPLLHKDVVDIVGHATARGLRTYLTSNGTHLGQKIDALHAAGLRMATIGFYGIDAAYDEYTQRAGHYQRLERSLTQVRERHGPGDFALQLNFVLTRQSCSVAAVDAAWAFAKRFDMHFHIDIVSFSVPFFNTGSDRSLLFREGDQAALQAVSQRLQALKRQEPARFVHSQTFLKSLPDWLMLQERMRVPCDAYEMLWIGADGTVQLCDVSFPLGNVNHQRLGDIMFGDEHRQACRDGFQLKCPNCICRVEQRTSKHWPSVIRYLRA